MTCCLKLVRQARAPAAWCLLCFWCVSDSVLILWRIIVEKRGSRSLHGKSDGESVGKGTGRGVRAANEKHSVRQIMALWHRLLRCTTIFGVVIYIFQHFPVDDAGRAKAHTIAADSSRVHNVWIWMSCAKCMFRTIKNFIRCDHAWHSKSTSVRRARPANRENAPN